jgi:hypothetical protein
MCANGVQLKAPMSGGRGTTFTTRSVGLVLLVVPVLLMAVPVGPILGARARRRKRGNSAR